VIPNAKDVFMMMIMFGGSKLEGLKVGIGFWGGTASLLPTS